jgi:hypothetical protein
VRLLPLVTEQALHPLLPFQPLGLSDLSHLILPVRKEHREHQRVFGFVGLCVLLLFALFFFLFAFFLVEVG